ncbi:MlaD family protein [Patulibacter defluvii]|uniref:MlaD family protein n=1 Tax=Patulibacter defluvii TaxID=3095358 RepID=UPI002A763653|nr:MlaD family protein [Patulibacter sp. DM4]
MIKKRPTIPQILAMIVFALSSFGCLLFLWVSFGGPVPLKPEGYRFSVLLPEATQLATTADVRISGVNVGKVVKIEPGVQNRTRATIELQGRFAPIPRNTRAMLRAKTLLGETYLELAPSRNDPGGTLPEGGALQSSRVESTVELDEILKTFDPKTRAAFRVWMQSQAQAVRGRAADFSATLAELPEFVDEMGRLSALLDAQQDAVRQSVSGTGKVFGAISARDGDLRGLVRASERTFSLLGARNRDLAAIFQRLPRFERETAATLPAFTRLAREGRPIVQRLLPAADELGPTFDALQRLSGPLRGFMERLGPLVTASERGVPALRRLLGDLPPLLEDFQPFLRQLDPMVRYLGQYRREITGFAGNLAAASQARQRSVGGGAPVNYLRASQTLSPEGLAFQQRPLGQSRRNAYVSPGGMGLLAQGLTSFSTASCANPDPPAPTASIPEGLEDLVGAYVFRNLTGGEVLRPGCKPQGPQPGYGTAYPHLTADPPVQLKGTR